MSYKNNLEKLLLQLSLCRTAQAPKIASKILSFFLLMKESANVRNIKHPIWENIYKTILIIEISEFSEYQKKLC